MTLPSISPQLLNAIPDPVLIIDKTQNVAAIANSQFVKLTAFTQTELFGMAISKLLEGVESLDFFSGEERKVKLSRRSRTAIEMVMTSAQADSSGQWLLLSFKPAETIAQQQLSTQMWGILADLVALLEREDYQAVLQEAAVLVARICNARQIGVYLAESSQPRLRLAASYQVLSSDAPDANYLPGELPAADLFRLGAPAIWTPGRRLQTDLYKAARAAGVSYLASAPIGVVGAPGSSVDLESAIATAGLVGLLVVSDLERQPAENLLEILPLLGAQLTAIHNQRAKLDDLSYRLRQQADALVLRNGQMEHQREGVLIISPDLTIMEINPTAEWMLGYTPEEVQDQPVQNILIGTKSLLPVLQDACAGIPTHNLSDVALHRRSGQSFPAQLRIIPVNSRPAEGKENPLGPIMGVLVFISDVSEHEQIQVRTQQLEHRALLGEVIAVFAHEVRNPINNIATGLQLMETWVSPGEGQAGDARQIQLIQRMLGDCQRLNHLMESVLQFSRPIEPKLEPLDLFVFLQRFLDRWRPRLARVNVTPYLNSEPTQPKVMADPRALEQVFTNLISNAVHAMATTGGTLAIRLIPNQTIANFPQVEITVSDTGPGIPEEFRSRLFEPFATTSPSGTGLGLAITKRIVTAHRGSIWVESFPGGTVFHILLPAELPIIGE